MGLRAEHLDLVVLWPLGRRFMFVFGEGGADSTKGKNIGQAAMHLTLVILGLWVLQAPHPPPGKGSTIQLVPEGLGSYGFRVLEALVNPINPQTLKP